MNEQRRLGLPEENLLYFLEKHAPKLEDWQAELLRIVRLLSQYFYPQRQTKMMNEGCATFVHYEILNRLYERGQLTDGKVIKEQRRDQVPCHANHSETEKSLVTFARDRATIISMAWERIVRGNGSAVKIAPVPPAFVKACGCRSH